MKFMDFLSLVRQQAQILATKKLLATLKYQSSTWLKLGNIVIPKVLSLFGSNLRISPNYGEFPVESFTLFMW